MSGGFGYKYSYLQHASILDAILRSFTGPTFTVPNSITPVDMGGFFVYLLDSSLSPTANPLCGTTTSLVGSCPLQQKSYINSDWCLLIGNFFVSQSVTFDISYQVSDTPVPPGSNPGIGPSGSKPNPTSTVSTSNSSESTPVGMSESTKIGVIIGSICGGLVIFGLTASIIFYKHSKHLKLKKYKNRSCENLDEDFLKYKSEITDMHAGGKRNDDGGPHGGGGANVKQDYHSGGNINTNNSNSHAGGHGDHVGDGHTGGHGGDHVGNGHAGGHGDDHVGNGHTGGDGNNIVSHTGGGDDHKISSHVGGADNHNISSHAGGADSHNISGHAGGADIQNIGGHLGGSGQGYNNSTDSPILYVGQNVQPIVKIVKDVKKVMDNFVVKDEVKEDKADILLIASDKSSDNEKDKGIKAHNYDDDVILKIPDEL
ncbi:22659_t:CDS:1 [Cetraspora pellucida]|uniref:22659_t:CDS:1 n=1 Tax=Cetraspora pellucida TaxID=1433469 RepID=A0A9N9HCL4_9GLOM|nr:22659_t:CDS:1 [Cetraspora pellucida]